jgi:hypothetical protein
MDLLSALTWIQGGMSTQALPLTGQTMRRPPRNLTIGQAATKLLRASRETASGLRGTDPASRIHG